MKRSMVLSSRFSVLGLLIAVGSSFFICHSSLGQGSLTPPGPPGPTMKTLEQIEPRTPITNLPVTITQPGSYYFVTNLIGGASGGITIAASGVTLDLMGFELVGGTGDGIFVSGSRTNICIRNGTVRGWSADGVDGFFTAYNSLFADLRVANNGGVGIATGGNCMLVNCVAEKNGGVYGIYAAYSTVSRCVAVENGGRGISSSGSVISDCVASYNTGDGISGGSNVRIGGCVAAWNGDDGIEVDNGCLVEHNDVRGNHTAGIHARADGNRIDSNHACYNDGDGILVDNTRVKNFVVRNTAVGNGGFQFRVPGIPGQPPAGANVVGPIVNDATNANANAWANIQQF